MSIEWSSQAEKEEDEETIRMLKEEKEELFDEKMEVLLDLVDERQELASIRKKTAFDSQWLGNYEVWYKHTPNKCPMRPPSLCKADPRKA